MAKLLPSSVNEYLASVLTKKQQNTVRDILRGTGDKKLFLIKGPQNATGKSTLANILSRIGCPAVEEWQVEIVELQMPLEDREPDFEQSLFNGG